MNKSIDTSVDPNDVIYVMNHHIKYKNSNRKSYMRLKVLAKDMNDDITQLCYLFYNAMENKTYIINDTQENVDVKRENYKLMKENIELRKEIDKSKELNNKLKKLNDKLKELKESMKSKENEEENV